MSYTDAIAEAYASAPVDEVTLDTLELIHPAFVDEAGRPTAIRVVRDYQNWKLRLEDGAQMGGGTYVEFLACEFDFTLPDVSDDATPQLQLSIGNVSGIVTRYLEQAQTTLLPIKVTYRPYLASDPATVQMDPVITLELSEIDVDVFQATGTATLEDVHNFPFPMLKYTTARFPGLKR